MNQGDRDEGKGSRCVEPLVSVFLLSFLFYSYSYTNIFTVYGTSTTATTTTTKTTKVRFPPLLSYYTYTNDCLALIRLRTPTKPLQRETESGVSWRRRSRAPGSIFLFFISFILHILTTISEQINQYPNRTTAERGTRAGILTRQVRLFLFLFIMLLVTDCLQLDRPRTTPTWTKRPRRRHEGRGSRDQDMSFFYFLFFIHVYYTLTNYYLQLDRLRMPTKWLEFEARGSRSIRVKNCKLFS